MVFTIYRLLAGALLLILLPLLAFFYLLVKLTSKGPFLFKQKRMGKDKKIFIMYKIRTMVDKAESLKSKVSHLNEADGPVFKIRDDPRYTKVGKFISHTGLDELPQLINVIKGEMVFVGPRPLPVEEAEKVPKKYERRFSVKPGITSPWVVEGSHRLTFKEWMELDLEYVKDNSFFYDLDIALRTILLIIRSIFVRVHKSRQITIKLDHRHSGKR
jgi:lipopolysaccharide/colanic/teichoic acid biosynthesis glycosyltransferase